MYLPCYLYLLKSHQFNTRVGPKLTKVTNCVANLSKWFNWWDYKILNESPSHNPCDLILLKGIKSNQPNISKTDS